MTKRWRVIRFGLALWSALAIVGLAGLGGTAAAVDTATMPVAASADASQQRLAELLRGESPKTVDDLKLIQTRVHELTKKVIAATVGVQVGPAWGSGVIVSKDGYVLTAAHVCGQPGRDVRFMLADGRVLKGKTLGLYRTLDAGL